MVNWDITYRIFFYRALMVYEQITISYCVAKRNEIDVEFYSAQV